MLSHSTLLLTFRKLLLVECWYNIKEKKNYNYLRGPLKCPSNINKWFGEFSIHFRSVKMS